MKNFSLNLNSIKKFFAYGDRIHVARDWFVLLVVGSVLLLLNIAWNAYLFVELENGKSIGSSASAPQASVGTSITQVQNIFQTRATEENNYQNTYHFVDPSVPSS